MSIALPRLTSDLGRFHGDAPPPIHWPSAAAGLVASVVIVVGVTWVASTYRPEARALAKEQTMVAQAGALKVAVPEPAQIVPTPIPPPPVQEAQPVAEKLRVANTRGMGVNLRATAGERGARIKTLPEGAALEAFGLEERVENLAWRQVREPGGTTGWVASSYLAKQ